VGNKTTLAASLLPFLQKGNGSGLRPPPFKKGERLGSFAAALFFFKKGNGSGLRPPPFKKGEQTTLSFCVERSEA
jgi:hypothetical protein